MTVPRSRTPNHTSETLFLNKNLIYLCFILVFVNVTAGLRLGETSVDVSAIFKASPDSSLSCFSHLSDRVQNYSVMSAVCESCFPTFSKLKEDIADLRTDLKEKDKLLMDFSAVASSQAKHITVLKSSGYRNRNTSTNDTTLPWTGSIN